MDLLAFLVSIGLVALLFVFMPGMMGVPVPDIVGYPSFTSLMGYIFVICLIIVPALWLFDRKIFDRSQGTRSQGTRSRSARSQGTRSQSARSRTNYPQRNEEIEESYASPTYDHRTDNQKAGDELENFVIRIFENRGYATTKDYDNAGIDILAKNETTWIGIQCKNWKRGRVMTDFELFDYAKRIGKWRSIDEVIIICTGGFESSFRGHLDVGQGLSIELWDRNILEEEANKEGMSWINRPRRGL